MSDDLERTLTEALDRHARRLGPRPDGHLDGVWSHLDRRRNRRRGVAAVGSVVAVGASVAGLALIGPGEPTAPSAGDRAPVTTLTGVAWRCGGLFGDDGVYRYYFECTPVAELPPLTTGWSPFTAPPTVPASTITLPFDFAATTAPVATVVAPPTNTAVDVIRYEVVQGDSLSSIATAYGIEPIDIALASGWDNGLEHPLFPGDVIDIAYVPAATAPPTVPTSSFVPAPTAPVCQDSEALVTVPCELVSATTSVIQYPVGTTTPPAPAPAITTYRCTGVLGAEGGFEYLAACDTIGPDGAVEPGPIAAAPTAPPPTTAFALPAMTVPATTAPPLSVAPDGSVHIVHVIGPGESPARVARRYGITVEELDAANDPTVMDTFIVGATLIIPAGAAPATAPMLTVSDVEQMYTVQTGDSISLIAGRFGVPMIDIVNYNAWTDGLDHVLRVGDTILIPPGALTTNP